MAFMDLFRKKTEEPKIDAKQRADQARQSGQRTADRIDAIFCKNTNGKIPGEKVSTYNQIIHNVADNIRHSETMDVEIENVDTVILKLVGLIRNSVEAGYSKLATEICEKLQVIINEDRGAISATDESLRNAQIKNRNDKVTLIGNIFEKKFKIEQNEETVENQKKQLAEKLQEAEKVKEQLTNLWNEKPWLKKSLQQLSTSDLSNPDVQEMGNIKQHLVNLANAKITIEQMINDTNEDTIALKASVDQDNALLINQKKFTNGSLVAHVQHSTQVLENQMAETDKEIEALDEGSQKFDTIMEERMTSQSRIDKHIERELKYEEMMEKERQKEEQKRQSVAENTVENTEDERILNQ